MGKQTVEHFRVEIVVEWSIPFGGGKQLRTEGFTFATTDDLAEGIALEHAARLERGLAMAKADAKLLAVRLLPLRLSRRNCDGSVDRRAWPADIRLVWSQDLAKSRGHTAAVTAGYSDEQVLV